MLGLTLMTYMKMLMLALTASIRWLNLLRSPAHTGQYISLPRYRTCHASYMLVIILVEWQSKKTRTMLVSKVAMVLSLLCWLEMVL